MPFDPTKPFEPVAQAKPKFDPSKDFTPAAPAVPSAEATAIHLPGDYNDAAAYDSGPAANDPKQVAEYTANAPQTASLYAGAMPVEGVGSLLGRAAIRSGIGAATGAASAPDGSRTAGAVTGGIAGPVLGAAGDTAASAGGSLADWLSQKSVGIRKYIPGVGTRLLDQGVYGTKQGMEDTVRGALPGAEQAVQDAALGITSKFDPETFASAVQAKAKNYITPDSGDTLNQAEIQKIHDTAERLRSMGSDSGESTADVANTQQLTARDVLSLKRQADNDAYLASGNKGASLDAELAGVIGDTARSQLNEASGGATGEALANQQALIKAKQSLNRPETVRQGVPMSTLFGSSIGGGVGGLPGAAAGAGVAQAARSPLVQSVTAKGLNEASPLAQGAGRLSPSLMNLLYGNSSGGAQGGQQ